MDGYVRQEKREKSSPTIICMPAEQEQTRTIWFVRGRIVGALPPMLFSAARSLTCRYSLLFLNVRDPTMPNNVGSLHLRDPEVMLQ